VGSYLLRHNLATRRVNTGTSLDDEVSDVLRSAKVCPPTTMPRLNLLPCPSRPLWSCFWLSAFPETARDRGAAYAAGRSCVLPEFQKDGKREKGKTRITDRFGGKRPLYP